MNNKKVEKTNTQTSKEKQQTYSHTITINHNNTTNNERNSGRATRRGEEKKFEGVVA